MKRRSLVGGLLALVGLGGAVKAEIITESKTVLTRENTADMGKRCNIFDASGQEVEYCLSAVLETGEVEVFARDRNGDFITNSNGDLLRMTCIRPAPLRVEWLSNDAKPRTMANRRLVRG